MKNALIGFSLLLAASPVFCQEETIKTEKSHQRLGFTPRSDIFITARGLSQTELNYWYTGHPEYHAIIDNFIDNPSFISAIEIFDGVIGSDILYYNGMAHALAYFLAPWQKNDSILKKTGCHLATFVGIGLVQLYYYRVKAALYQKRLEIARAEYLKNKTESES